jgi:hypothetical protein
MSALQSADHCRAKLHNGQKHHNYKDDQRNQLGRRHPHGHPPISIGRSASDQVDFNVDIAAGGFRIRTTLIGAF